MQTSLLLGLIVGVVKLVDGCCAFKRRSADHESVAAGGIQFSFYSKSASRHWQQIKLSLDRKPRLIEGFESETEGFNYNLFVDALEEDGVAALQVLELPAFKEKYALGAILRSISGAKEQAFTTLVAALKPLNRFEVNLEHFIKALDGWSRNGVLKRMLAVIQEECGVKMDETSRTLELSFTKNYLLGLTTFARLREVKNAYAAKEQPFLLTEALFRAIIFNNLLLLRDILAKKDLNVNGLYYLPDQLGSAFNNAFHKFDSQIRYMIGTSKITALMFAFIMGRGAAAEIIASRPDTRIILETHEMFDVLEIYQRLRPHDKAAVHPALQLRNHVDLSKVEGTLQKYEVDSLAEAILQRSPNWLIKTFFWKGLDSFSLDAVLAAIYQRNYCVLEKFVGMGWLKFESLDEGIKSLIFETLLLRPPSELREQVKELLKFGFDFRFGGDVIDGFYVPKTLDYYLTKRMTPAHLKEWIKLYEVEGWHHRLPALHMDLIISAALANFDEEFLSWIVSEYPESMASHVSPIHSEPLMFTVLRSYYPVTRDLQFVKSLKTILEVELSDQCLASKEIIQPASLFSNNYDDGIFKRMMTATMLVSTPAKYNGVHYHDLRTIKKGAQCSIQDLCWAVQDAKKLLELFKSQPRVFTFKERSVFKTTGIGSPASLTLDLGDNELSDWAFHASLVQADFSKPCGFKKEEIDDNYAIGPEGNSVFHIIVSPRAAHHKIQKLVNLIKYFGEERKFYVDYAAIEGEEVVMKHDDGKEEKLSTKGWTAFMVAMARKTYVLADALVVCGADIYATSSDGTCFAYTYIKRLEC